MRAVVLDQSGVRFDSCYPDPQPRADEILVRVTYAGICETDLQLMRGYMGFRGVLGHEFVGVAQSGRFAGQRVVGEINCSCRQCPTCHAGLGTHCPHRSVVGILNHDGAFADVVAIPEANLHPVPESLDDQLAVFAEPVAAAFQIPAQIPLKRGTRAIVLGDGRLGTLCAQVLKLHECDTLLIGKHAEKLSRMRELKIDASLLSDLKPDRSADLVVDCTGSATGLPTALRWVRPRGTVVLKTTVAGEQTLALAPIVIDEISVVGSRCGPFAPALQALSRGDVHVAPLIDRIVPLESAPIALAESSTRKDFKVLIQMEH